MLTLLWQDLFDDLFDLVLDDGHFLGLLIETDDLLKIDDGRLVQPTLVLTCDHLYVIDLQIILLKITDMMLVILLQRMILIFQLFYPNLQVISMLHPILHNHLTYLQFCDLELILLFPLRKLLPHHLHFLLVQLLHLSAYGNTYITCMKD